MIQTIDIKKKSPPKFDPGEEVYFEIEDYGAGRGNVAAFYIHNDGSRLYAVYPKNPRLSDRYNYVCIIIREEELMSTPF